MAGGSPQRIYAFFGIGMCLFRENRPQEGYLCFGRALDILADAGQTQSSAAAVLHNNLGCCLTKLGHLDAALEAFEVAEGVVRECRGECGALGMEVRANHSRVLGKAVQFRLESAPRFKFYWKNPAEYVSKPVKK